MSSIPQAPQLVSHDAGIVGLRAEITNTPTAALVDQLTLLVGVHPVLLPLAANRIHLLATELRRRRLDGSRAA